MYPGRLHMKRQDPQSVNWHSRRRYSKDTTGEEAKTVCMRVYGLSESLPCTPRSSIPRVCRMPAACNTAAATRIFPPVLGLQGEEGGGIMPPYEAAGGSERALA